MNNKYETINMVKVNEIYKPLIAKKYPELYDKAKKTEQKIETGGLLDKLV